MRKFIYGRLSKTKTLSFKSGIIGQFVSKFSNLKIDAFFVIFNKKTEYDSWIKGDVENLCIIKEGNGKIFLDGKFHNLNENIAFKIYPTQKPLIIPNKNLKIISVQRPSSILENKNRKIDITKLEIVDATKIPEKVYEFETLAKEIFTPKYKNSLGLIRFVFVNPIPIHKHPLSARIILPIKGNGITYIKPNIYEAHNDTFAVFNKNVIHTNGPLIGKKIYLDAVQIPWIPSGIDRKNIAGSPKFVRYIGITPPKKLWKTKDNMKKLLESLKF